MHCKFSSALYLAAICLLACGCSSSSTVTGTVTMDGVPLPNGEVMFHPDGGGAMAIGMIDNGKYQMQTGQSDNVEPGSYSVTVIALEQLTPEQLEAAPNPNGVEIVPKRITPDVYADASTSPLKKEVKSGANTYNIELKSNP